MEVYVLMESWKNLKNAYDMKIYIIFKVKKVYVIVLSTLMQIIEKIYLLIYFEFIDDFGSGLPYLSVNCTLENGRHHIPRVILFALGTVVLGG